MAYDVGEGHGALHEMNAVGRVNSLISISTPSTSSITPSTPGRGAIFRLANSSISGEPSSLALPCSRIRAGLWKANRRRAQRVHSPRPRRSCLGELAQIDGSHHDWFEGR